MASKATKAAHVPMRMHEVTVSAVTQVTPRMRRFTFAGSTLRKFVADGPDQRLKLLLPRSGQARPVVPSGPDGWYKAWRAMSPDLRPWFRTYTVSRSRPADGEIDVDIIVHGDCGPGTRWASRAEPGDVVAVHAPYAEYEASANSRQLICGDQTALPAISAIVEQLDPSTSALVVIEVPDPDECIELTAGPQVEITWLTAGQREPGHTLIDSVIGLPKDPVPDYVWVAADNRTAVAIRRHLVRVRQLRPDQVMFSGYWRTDGPIDTN